MQGANEADEVEQAFGEFIAAFNAMDLQRLRNCFSPQITLFAPAAVPGLIVGAGSVCAHFERVFEAEPASGPTVRPAGVQVSKLAPGVALVTFEFARPLGSVGRRTIAFQESDGHWWVAHIHASNT